MIFRSSEAAERFRARQFIDDGPQSMPNSRETSASLNWESDIPEDEFTPRKLEHE